MSNRFILPIALDFIRVGGQRIRAARTLSLQRQPVHWGKGGDEVRSGEQGG